MIAIQRNRALGRGVYKPTPIEIRWRLSRFTAIPVARVFILIGYLLAALLLLDVAAALWQVREPSEVIWALRRLLPYESLAFALVALMGVVWVVKGFLHRPRENVEAE